MATTVDKQTISAQKTLEKRGEESGSKPVKHAADLLDAHNELVAEKNLTKRFQRIGKHLKQLKKQSPSDWERSQKQVKALRPLLRLAVRSPEFRQSGITFLKVMKDEVFNENIKEKVHDKSKELKEESKEKHLKEGKKHEGDKVKKEKVKKFQKELEKDLARDTQREREREVGAMSSKRADPYLNPIPTPTMPAPAPQALVPASAVTKAKKGTGITLSDEIKHAVEKRKAEAEKPKEKAKEKEKLKEKTKEKKVEKEKSKEKVKEKEGEHKEKLKDKEKSKGVLKGSNRKISDKSWKQMSKQLHPIFLTWSSHSEYQQGVRELLDLPELIINEGNKNTKVPAAKELQEETLDLIAQFSGRKVLDKLFKEIQLLHDSSNETARKWWKDFKKIIVSTMDDYDGKEDLTPLRHHLDKSFDIFETYRPRINRIIDLLSDIFNKMSNDKYVQGLRERLSIVADDIYWKKGDNWVVDTDAIGELSVALSDILRKQLATIKIDDIKGTDRKGSYHLSHLKIKNTIPERLSFHLESEAIIDTSPNAPKKLKTELVLSASVRGIRTEIPNLHFSFTGLISDSGVADVIIPSSDLSVDFVYMPKRVKEAPGVNVRTNNTILRFVNMRTHFHTANLQINWHKDTMNHSVLVPFATRLFQKQLVRNLELGVQNAMNQNIEVVGEKMANILVKSPSMSNVGNFRFANKELRKKHHKDVSHEKAKKKHHDITSDASPKIDRQKTLHSHA